MENLDALTKAEEVIKRYTVVELKKLNDSLQHKVDSLRKTNEELIIKVLRLENSNQ